MHWISTLGRTLNFFVICYSIKLIKIIKDNIVLFQNVIMYYFPIQPSMTMQMCWASQSCSLRPRDLDPYLTTIVLDTDVTLLPTMEKMWAFGWEEDGMMVCIYCISNSYINALCDFLSWRMGYWYVS